MKKIIALILIITFIGTDILMAAPAVPAPLPAPEAPKAALEKIVLPEELGSIQELHLSQPSQPFVVFIQDAHAVLDAQKKIQHIIEYLGKRYGINSVALEGASGRLDFTLLKAFPDETLKKKVLQGYVERGELTGAEMNALLGSEKLTYQGIEDWDLYQENYLAYLRAIQVKPALLAKLAQSQKKLDEERLRVYSAKLNEFHETINSFHEERLNLLELLKYLNARSFAQRSSPLGSLRMTGKSARHYPNLTILFNSIADEDSAKEENLQKSVRRLAEEIKRHLAGKLSLQEEMTFHKNYQTYVTGQMESGAYLKFLVEAARKSGFTPKLTPLMLKAMGLEETLSMMKGKKVFEELEAFLQETENRLTVAMEEKQIAEEYRKIRLLKNVISLEATRDEVEESRKSEIASALLGALPRNDSSVIASERSASGSTSREARRERSNPVFNLYYASEFYRLVLKRDEAMHQNLEKLLAREKSGRIMVLAGGFHTAGFEKTLKEKHYNYAIITPNIRSLAGSEVYAEVMKGKFSFREEFEGDFYKAFHRHVSNELVSELNGPDFQNILKLWRDEIIRRLSREKRIEQAPDYTPYVDRLWPVYFEKYGSRSTRINFRKTKLLRMMRRESKRFVQEKIDRYLARLEKNPSASINGPLAASSIIQLAGLSFMPKTDVRSEIRNLIRTGEMPSISQETFSAEEGLIRRARSEARNLVSYTDLTEPEQKKVMGFGNKAAQLALLAQLGISVPPAMAVRLESIYRDFQEAEIIEEFKLIIRILEEKTGLEFGSPKKPLLLAVRSSPVESHPGRFDTVLNAGLTDQTVEALAEWGGEDFAYRSYVEFLQKYAESIFQISRTDPANRELFESSPDAGESWKTFAGRIRASRPMSAIPQDPYKQLIEVLNFILRGLNDVTSGTVLQEMVFGNLNDQSMSGVLTTRDVETGENELRGRFHRKATGRTVVSGDAGEDIAVLNEPEIVASLQEAKRKLEKATGYVQDMEFVVQSRGEGKRIVVVQTRNAPVANPATQIRILRDMNRERILDERVLAARIADLEKQKVQIFKASPESGTLPILVSGEGLGDMAVQGKVLSLAEIKSSAAAGILYIENPYTNEVLELIRTRRIIGLITSAKNRFSHLAMQARIMRIPVLFGVQGPFEHLGKNVLLDAAESVLREAQENKNYVEPFPGLIELPGMEEILEAEDVFNRLKAAGNMTSLDFKREHTNYLRELAALQPEASAENSSRALFLNALAHRIHEYIPELEKKEMEAGFLTGVTLWSREELDDVWREELGIDVNLRTISFYEDRPEDRPKIQRALEILKENVVHHPQVKAWIEKYGADNLRIEVSFRVGFETSRLPMFRVSVVLPSRVTRIYYRRIGVGYKHNMRNSYDKTPAVDTAIAEAQAVAQRHAGAEAIAYVHVEEWHERGVYDAYWDVSVYEPLDAAASEMRVIEQGQRLSRFFSHWFESWTAHYRSKAFAENAVENVGVVMLPARITSSLRQYLWPDEDSFYVGDRYGTKPEIWGTNTINVRTPSPRFFSWNSAILPQNKPVVEIGMSLKRENQGRKFISTFWRAVRESFSEKAVLMMRIQNISTLMSLAEALDQHSNNWDTLLTRIRDKRRYWDLPELSDSNLSVEDQIPAIRELIEDRQWLVRKLVEYLKSDQFNIEANRQRIFKALRESRLAAPMIRHLDDGNLRLVVTTDKRRGKVYEAVTVLFEPTADIARSEVRFQANVVAALQAAAHIGWDDLTNGDLQGAMDEAISNIYGGPAPPFTRPPALKLSDIIELMSENKAVIDPVMILPKVETEFGTIDLAYLNNVTLYEGEDAALRLARDLHLAHRLGLITIEKFKGVSPSTQTLKLLKEKGKQLKTIPITWSNGIVLRFKFSGLKTANTLMKYKGNDEQIKFYFEVFGRESARNKHAGALFSAISSLVPKELGWQRMDLNLGLAEDLREDFGRKLKEAGWIDANSGDGKQIDYYISFLKSNGIDARNKHAGALFSAISSLVPKELGWQVMQLNLGLAEDLRADFGRKLKEAGWIEANSGDGKQIDYYISFLKSKGIDARNKHAGALFSAISSLVPKELGWQVMHLNLGLAEDLRKDFGRKLKEAGWIEANSGDGKQIDYYISFLKSKGIDARNKHAGALFSAISSLVPKELGWQRMNLNLGLAEDLREDFGRKLKEAGWINANSGDGKQIDYYISFLKSKGINARDKHAGALFSAISSLVPKELGWQRMNLNLGLAEDLREDFAGRLKSSDEFIKQYRGSRGQVQYFLDAVGDTVVGMHADSLLSAISSLLDEEITLQDGKKYLREHLEWKYLNKPMSVLIEEFKISIPPSKSSSEVRLPVLSVALPNLPAGQPTFRVAAVQMNLPVPPLWKEDVASFNASKIDEAFKRIEAVLQQLSSEETNLIVFPEFFVPLTIDEKYPEIPESTFTDIYERAVRLAQSYKRAIGFGVTAYDVRKYFNVDASILRNEYVVIQPDGSKKIMTKLPEMKVERPAHHAAHDFTRLMQERTVVIDGKPVLFVICSECLELGLLNKSRLDPSPQLVVIPSLTNQNLNQTHRFYAWSNLRIPSLTVNASHFLGASRVEGHSGLDDQGETIGKLEGQEGILIARLPKAQVRSETRKLTKKSYDFASRAINRDLIEGISTRITSLMIRTSFSTLPNLSSIFSRRSGRGVTISVIKSIFLSMASKSVPTWLAVKKLFSDITDKFLSIQSAGTLSANRKHVNKRIDEFLNYFSFNPILKSQSEIRRRIKTLLERAYVIAEPTNIRIRKDQLDFEEAISWFLPYASLDDDELLLLLTEALESSSEGAVDSWPLYPWPIREAVQVIKSQNSNSIRILSIGPGYNPQELSSEFHTTLREIKNQYADSDQKPEIVLVVYERSIRMLQRLRESLSQLAGLFENQFSFKFEIYYGDLVGSDISPEARERRWAAMMEYAKPNLAFLRHTHIFDYMFNGKTLTAAENLQSLDTAEARLNVIASLLERSIVNGGMLIEEAIQMFDLSTRTDLFRKIVRNRIVENGSARTARSEMRSQELVRNWIDEMSQFPKLAPEIKGLGLKKFLNEHMSLLLLNPLDPDHGDASRRFLSRFDSMSMDELQPALETLFQIYEKYTALMQEVNQRLERKGLPSEGKITHLLFVSEGEYGGPMRYVRSTYHPQQNVIALNVDFLSTPENDIGGIQDLAHEAGHGWAHRFLDRTGLPMHLEEDEELYANWAAAHILTPDEIQHFIENQVMTRLRIAELRHESPATMHSIAYLKAFARENQVREDSIDRLGNSSDALIQQYQALYKRLRWAKSSNSEMRRNKPAVVKISSKPQPRNQKKLKEKTLVIVGALGEVSRERYGPLLKALAEDYPTTRFVGVDRRKKSDAEGVMAQHPMPFSYKDYYRPGDFKRRVKANDIRPDGIVILATPNAHLSYIRWALERGIPVFVEKPLVLPGQIDQLIELYQKYPRLIFAIDHVLERQAVLEALRLATPELLGDIVGIEGKNLEVKEGANWMTDPKISGGGQVLDKMVHLITPLELLLRPFGKSFKDFKIDPNPRQLRFARRKNAAGERETYGWVRGNLKGIKVNLEVGDGMPRNGRFIILRGTKGILRINVKLRDGRTSLQYIPKDKKRKGWKFFPDSETGQRDIVLKIYDQLHGLGQVTQAERDDRFWASVTAIQVVEQAQNRFKGRPYKKYQTGENPRRSEMRVSSPFPRLKQGRTLKLQTLWSALNGKYTFRNIMKGGAIAQPPFYISLKRDRRVLRQMKKEGFTEFYDLSVDGEFTDAADEKEIAVALAEIIDQIKIRPVIFKPNQKMYGNGIFVLQQLPDERVQLSMLYAENFGSYENKLSEKIKRFVEEHGSLEADLSFRIEDERLLVNLPRDRKKLHDVLLKIWMMISTDDQNLSKGIYDAGGFEQFMTFVRPSGDYEMRITIEGDLNTGLARVLWNEDYEMSGIKTKKKHGVEARLGGDVFWNSGQSNKIRLLTGEEVFNPLYESGVVSRDRKTEFESWFNQRLLDQFKYFSQRLQTGGIHLEGEAAKVYLEIDLKWMSETTEEGWPTPVIIEGKIYPANFQLAKQTKITKLAASELRHFRADFDRTMFKPLSEYRTPSGIFSVLSSGKYLAGLQTGLQSYKDRGIVEAAEIQAFVERILGLVVLGEKGVPAYYTNINGTLDIEKIKADQKRLEGILGELIKNYRGPKTELITNHPGDDPATQQVISKGLLRFQDQIDLTMLYRPDQKITRTILGAVHALFRKVVRSHQQTVGEIVARGINSDTVLLWTEDLNVNGNGLGVFSILAEISRLSDTLLKNYSYDLALYAIFKFKTLEPSAQRELLKSPELLRQFYVQDPYLSSLMGSQGGNLRLLSEKIVELYTLRSEIRTSA